MNAIDACQKPSSKLGGIHDLKKYVAGIYSDMIAPEQKTAF